MRTKKGPYTLIIRRIVKPNHIKEYERWLNNAARQVKNIEGNLGVYIVRPIHTHHPEYILIVQFDTQENLLTFKNSQLRKQWLEKLKEISLGSIVEKDLSIFDTWFVSSKEGFDNIDLPPRYKTFIITTITVFPLVIILNYVMNFFPINNSLLKLLLTLTIAIGLMTYIIIPYLSKKIRFWLYT
ncbi:hypothetical protein A2164_02730 [Candidatus Curtissbacteria bacterium RBG_13_35_7]|uniref:ABM domain-containing protein n=1 Tax=Candidatus Curtissbacteria bacterium RBG_13_35_7 TaxID=1797705 RepID=A0A1F5G486_9BACT|nr:MAG: hypothetical protein A2164_02730 [Candidatus Curtissbacteria bacterium RBG_13_35_7]